MDHYEHQETKKGAVFLGKVLEYSLFLIVRCCVLEEGFQQFGSLQGDGDGQVLGVVELVPVTLFGEPVDGVGEGLDLVFHKLG